MSRLTDVRDRLVREDAEFRRLHDKHADYDRRLQALQSRRYLTDEERVEESRLKKLKLSLKDRMEAMVRNSTG